MKSWFNWRSLRRPKLPAPRPTAKRSEDGAITAAPLRLKPKARPLWQRFGRKPSPFELRPGAVESWMKARPAPDEAARRPNHGDRGDIRGGR